MIPAWLAIPTSHKVSPTTQAWPSLPSWPHHSDSPRKQFMTLQIHESPPWVCIWMPDREGSLHVILITKSQLGTCPEHLSSYMGKTRLRIKPVCQRRCKDKVRASPGYSRAWSPTLDFRIMWNITWLCMQASLNWASAPCNHKRSNTAHISE